MKVFFLVIRNFIRLSLIRIFKCNEFIFSPIQMIGRNTRISVKKTSRVFLGNRVVSDGRMTIIVEKEGDLSIGSRVYFNEYAMISCIKKVSIGDGCQFGPHVCIFDSNHRFSAEEGVSHFSKYAPITIGERCWIGANVVLLKGTEIGDNCVIGAGCVITGKIPPNSIVTMNRTLEIKQIK